LRYSAYIGRTSLEERGLTGKYLTHTVATILPVRSRTFQWITPLLYIALQFLVYAYGFRLQARTGYTNSMQGKPLVFVDVETTGGSAYSSRILEIGALRVEGGRVVEQINQVLDPEEPVPGWITQLTGIEPHETNGKPRFAEIETRLTQLFTDAVFVAHNVNFDYSFFQEEFRRLGRTFQMDKLCTVRLSRALYPGERSHRLDEVIRRHGYIVANRHRAYDDAEVLHKFYDESLEKFGADSFYTTIQRLVQPKQSRPVM